MSRKLKIAIFAGLGLIAALAAYLVYTGVTYGGPETLGLP
jgi:hypothetical protein